MDENGGKNNLSDPSPIRTVLEQIDAEIALSLRRYERRMEELRITKNNKKEATE